MLKDFQFFVIFLSFTLTLYWLFLYIINKKSFKIDPKLKEYPFFSILVPAFNEEKTIGLCIESLLKIDYPKNKVNIILINDASTDSTLKIMKSFKDSRIKILDLKKNTGWKSAALKKGLKLVSSKTDLLTILDADSVVSKNIARVVAGYFSDKKVGAVATRYLPLNSSNLLERFQYIEYLFSVMWRRLLWFVKSMYVSPGVFATYDYNVFKKVGGFSKDSIVEDLEIAFRINKAGYDIAYTSSTPSFTRVPSTIKEYISQRTRWQRGFIRTVLDYKNMLFDKRLGNYGLIFLPIVTFSTFLMITTSLLFLYKVLDKVFEFFKGIYKLYLIGFDVSTVLDFSNIHFDLKSWLYERYLYSDAFTYLFLISFLLTVIILVLIFKIFKEPLKPRILDYFAYIIIYLPLYSLLWLKNITVELLFKDKGLEWKKKN